MTEIKKKKTSTKKVKLVEAEAEPMVVKGDGVTGLQGDKVTELQSDAESRLKPAERPAEASGTGAENGGTEIGGTASAGTVEEPGKVTVKLTRWMGYLPPGAVIKMDKAAADKAVASGKGVLV